MTATEVLDRWRRADLRSPRVAEPRARAAGARARVFDAAPAVAVCLTVAWWLGVVARGWGGRSAGTVTVGALLTAVAVLVTRVDRVLPLRVVLPAAALSLAAFAVALTTATGWAGASRAADYACVGWIGCATAAAIVGRRSLARTVALLVAAAAAVEFAEAWLPWWGGESAAKPMIGTFYWHDPFAAFLLAGTMLGCWFWVQGRRIPALLGLVALVLGTTGVVYSTSRAALACLVVGFTLLTAGALLGAGRLRALVRLGVGAAVTAGGVYLVAGPPFFPSRTTPGAALAARTAHQSLGQNGGYRLDFWREAIGVFERHPVTGGGYHSLVAQSAGHVPAAWPLSPYAHNGYLQVLAVGGLALAIPFLLLVAGAAALALRSAFTAVVRRELTLEGFAVPVAFLALLGHAAVDFDWAYPANLAMTAVLGGLVVGSSDWIGRARRLRRPPALPLVATGVVLLGLAAWTARHGDMRENLPIAADRAQALVKDVTHPADSGYVGQALGSVGPATTTSTYDSQRIRP